VGLLHCAPPRTRAPRTTPSTPTFTQALPQGGFLPPQSPPPVRDTSEVQPWVNPLGMLVGGLPLPQGLPFPGLSPQVPQLGGLVTQASQVAVLLGKAAISQIPLPRKRKQGEQRPGCGYAVVQGQQIPLDCATPDYGAIPWSAQRILGEEKFRLSEGHTGKVPLPPEVDHRKTRTEGPIRDQGQVGACTAFSLASSIDNALLHGHEANEPVSVMHIWSRYRRPSMEAAARAVRNQAIAPETRVIYDEKTACGWYPCEREYQVHRCADYYKTSCGQNVSSGFTSHAENSSYAEVTEITKLNHRDIRSLMGTIAKGHDIWFSMMFDPVILDTDELTEFNGASPLVRHFTRREAKSAHAIVLSGYKITPDGAYFLIHNSWGERWGDRGYAWIHENTLQENIESAYLVDARPIRSSPSKPIPTECPESLAPDSFTGECVPLCPDGSPRYRGVCAAPTTCPPGFTNLSGYCVVAPVPQPQVQRDPATGVYWRCGAGGCAYAIPGGSWGCQRRWCSVSCPSPRYMLTVTQTGFSCSE
jgi:hypothetical protein